MNGNGRHTNWTINQQGGNWSFEAATLAVLMDLRDELKTLNRVFACPNFQQVPRVLRDIRRNTTKKQKAKAAR